jgi:hypothetical protein
MTRYVCPITTTGPGELPQVGVRLEHAVDEEPMDPVGSFRKVQSARVTSDRGNLGQGAISFLILEPEDLTKGSSLNLLIENTLESLLRILHR